MKGESFHMSSKNLRNKITKSSLIILIFTILGIPFSYLSRMLLSRALSQEMFGLFYAVIAFFSLLATYNDLGFGYSVSYLVPKFKSRKDLSKLWNTFLYDLLIETGTSIILGAVVYFSANWIADSYFSSAESVSLLRLGIIYFISHSITSALRSLFVGLEDEKVYSSINIINYLITAIGTGFLYLFTSSSTPTYFLFWSLSHVLTALIVLITFMKKYSYMIKKTLWNGDLFKKMFAFAGPSLMATTFGTIVRSSDVFFLTIFTGLTAVGGYNVIVPTTTLPQTLLSPIQTSFLPLISALNEKAPEQISQITEKVLKTVPIIATYFCLYIILYPNALIQTLFGSKWVKLTIGPLRILAIATIFNVTSGFLGVISSGLGLIKEKMQLSIVLVTISLLSGTILIRSHGLIGAAWGAIIIHLFGVIINLFLISRKVKYNLPINLYIKLFSFSGAVILLTNFLKFRINGIFEIIISGMIYTIIFSLFIFFQQEIRNDIWETIKLVGHRLLK